MDKDKTVDSKVIVPVKEIQVSVIIVSYNTRELLKTCIDSIKQQTKNLSYEIIVVDNDSCDGTVEMLQSAYQDVVIIRNTINLGFGKANNIGSKKANGKYLFYLNSDTLLLNNAIKIFYDFAESLDHFGALGCILIDSNRTPCHSYGKFITPKNELKEGMARYLRFLKDSNKFHPAIIDSPLEVDYITGADLFVPRDVFKSMNGFDPAFFMYCEEVDWQQRMSKLGLKRIIIPGPSIIHLEGGSDSSKTRLWSHSRRNNFKKSKEIYYKKHFNKRTYPLFKFCKTIIDLPMKPILAIYDYFIK